MTATNYTVQSKQWRYKYFYQTCSSLPYFEIVDMVICGRDKRSNTPHPWNTYQTEHLDLSKKSLSKCLRRFWLAVGSCSESALSQLDSTFNMVSNTCGSEHSPCWSVFEQDAGSSAAPGGICIYWPEREGPRREFTLRGMKKKHNLVFGHSLVGLYLTGLVTQLRGTK